MKTKTYYGVYSESGVCCMVAESKAEVLAYFPYSECDNEHSIRKISESAARAAADL